MGRAASSSSSRYTWGMNITRMQKLLMLTLAQGLIALPTPTHTPEKQGRTWDVPVVPVRHRGRGTGPPREGSPISVDSRRSLGVRRNHAL